MRIVVFDDDGNEIEQVSDVEKTGLEMDPMGGVSLANHVRTTLALALYPYWMEAAGAPIPVKRTPTTPGTVTAFRPRGKP